MREYKDDVKELETIVASKQVQYLTETRSAKALSKRIDKLVLDLDGIVQTLDKKQDKLKQDISLETEQNTQINDQIQQQKDFLAEKRFVSFINNQSPTDFIVEICLSQHKNSLIPFVRYKKCQMKRSMLKFGISLINSITIVMDLLKLMRS